MRFKHCQFERTCLNCCVRHCFVDLLERDLRSRPSKPPRINPTSPGIAAVSYIHWPRMVMRFRIIHGSAGACHGGCA